MKKVKFWKNEISVKNKILEKKEIFAKKKTEKVLILGQHFDFEQNFTWQIINSLMRMLLQLAGKTKRLSSGTSKMINFPHGLNIPTEKQSSVSDLTRQNRENFFRVRRMILAFSRPMLKM